VPVPNPCPDLVGFAAYQQSVFKGTGTMAESKTQRKLTAILCADVVGYSRLMGADEEATIETLTAYRKVFTSKIKKHRGRVVDAKGDAILAEFASVVNAVERGERPPIDGTEARKAMRLILAIYQSAKNGGRPVRLE